MTEPDWISRELCIDMHERELARYGGLTGIRDEGLLDSALNRPRQLFSFGDPNIQQLAAAYAFGIARNHPFLDGNKRCALMAALFFLESNGYEFSGTSDEAIVFTLELAAGTMSEAAFCEWLTARSDEIR